MSVERGATYLPGGLPIGRTLLGAGPVASRPDADDELTPRFWFDTDTGQLSVDLSGTWVALIPGMGDDSTNLYGTDTTQRLEDVASAGSRWAIRVLGEPVDSAFLYRFGFALGGGNGSADVAYRRVAAGVAGIYDAYVAGNLAILRIGDAAGATDAMNRQSGDVRWAQLAADNTFLGDLTQLLSSTSSFGSRFAIKRLADTQHRAFMTEAGFALGSGSAAADVAYRRISAGVAGVYDAYVAGNLAILRIAEPVGSTDATTKGYVDTGLATKATGAAADFVQADDGGKEEYDSHGGAAVGATETIDLANGNVHRCILDENVTFTFTGSTASVACSFTLILVQDGSGTNTVTWPASVDWAGGVAPTIATGANDVTILTFLTVDNGTTWFGFLAGADMG